MTKISAARAIAKFFDELPLDKKQKRNTTSNVIAEKYGVNVNSIEYYTILHTHRENLITLISMVNNADSLSSQSKSGYRDSLQHLLSAIEYPSLHQDWASVREKSILPHTVKLSFLEDQLRLGEEITEDKIVELTEITKKLSKLLDEVKKSSLDVAVKAKIIVSLSALLFVLSNYDTLGLEKAWEMAASTQFATQEAARHSAPAAKNLLLQISVFLTATLGAITMFNGFADQGTKALNHIVDFSNMLSGIERPEKQIVAPPHRQLPPPVADRSDHQN